MRISVGVAIHVARVVGVRLDTWWHHSRLLRVAPGWTAVWPHARVPLRCIVWHTRADAWSSFVPIVVHLSALSVLGLSWGLKVVVPTIVVIGVNTAR